MSAAIFAAEPLSAVDDYLSDDEETLVDSSEDESGQKVSSSSFHLILSSRGPVQAVTACFEDLYMATVATV